MKILVFGADGFVGSAVVKELSNKHDLFKAMREKSEAKNEVSVDLKDKGTILKALINIKPEVVINCAGVVENSEKANLNVVFTSNLLEVIKDSNQAIKRIIICGSASEYGVVGNDKKAVSETTRLNPNSLYGQSKIKESTLALEFGKKNKLPVIVVRIFNPIGTGMNPRLLLPNILNQIDEIKNNKRKNLEINRLDSNRDYINIKDVASAISLLVENNPKHKVYNIGSGASTSNKELIDFALVANNIKSEIIEVSLDKEPNYASKADISRLRDEFGWASKYSVSETLREIVSGNK